MVQRAIGASIPRILIAGQASGVGKTTITLGLIAALRRRGLHVQSFKCGPDYIDPTYHTLASGRPCRNLDTWMLSTQQMQAEFNRASADADVAVIEGVMGLFDGSSYAEESGSSAQIAKALDAPVLLVLDIGKLARSAGALALGYHNFDPALPLAGFILNRAGSAKHAKGCASAIQQATGLPSPGWLSKHSGLQIPERHLGLIPTGERTALNELIEGAADAIEEGFDLDTVLSMAGRSDAPTTRTQIDAPPCTLLDERGSVASRHDGAGEITLAVARDEAFSFYYPANLELLEAAGARIHFFSPLHGETIPTYAAGVYLGGGFPELYAEQLSANRQLWADLQTLYAADCPIYAECGGFMVLTQALTDLAGKRWPMAGIIPGETQMVKRLAGLGYRHATAPSRNLLLDEGATVRGHEFHYSEWQVTAPDVPPAWQLSRRNQTETRTDGFGHGNLLASYLHIHFGQNPELATRFVTNLEAAHPRMRSSQGIQQSV